MTEAEVRNRILIFADGEQDPVLTSADLDILVSLCRGVDKAGIYPTEAGWTETYNWNYGVAQAWLLRASRTSPRYLFMSGGKMFSRQQFYDHCLKQYRIYIGKAGIRALRLAADPLGLGLVPNNANA